MRFLFALSLVFLVACDTEEDIYLDDQVAEAEERIKADEEARQEARETRKANAVEQSLSPGEGGFLWKPVSEGDGNLVILLPGALRGAVAGVTISGAFGSEVGRFAGDQHNGGRPHYRFSHPGGHYGSSITVTARTEDEDITWSISNGASRTEH